MQKQKNLKGHQGDVFFKQICALPEGAVPCTNEPIALGEQSGHMHVLCGDVQMHKMPDGKIVSVIGEKGAVLRHVHESNFKGFETKEDMQVADHEPHTLEKGVYEFWIQNEYNPFSKMLDKVTD